MAKAKFEFVLQPHVSLNFMFSSDASPAATVTTDGIVTDSMGISRLFPGKKEI
jgi:hypothetical protein